MKRFLFTGDLVVNQHYNFCNGLKDLFEGSISIVNLESPVTKRDEKLKKTGPHLRMDKSNLVEVINQLHITMFCLANNHILDYKIGGLLDTIDVCSSLGVKCIGLNRQNAPGYYIQWIKNVAVINICENEWSTYGVNLKAQGYDPSTIFNVIKSVSRHSYQTIVIYHGGNEYYELPSPMLQRRLRSFVENGADLVIAHHTHVISGMECWRNGRIYYGLGNFVFSREKEEDSAWTTGLVVEMLIDDDDRVAFNEYFTSFNSKNASVVIQDGINLKKTIDLFQDRSLTIRTPGSLNAAWASYVESIRDSFEWQLSPLFSIKNRLLRKLIYLVGIKGLSHEYKRVLINYIRCESLSDISLEVLNSNQEKNYD